MSNLAEGIIIKGIDGFYFVDTQDTILKCKARGIFRKKGMVPLAGDRVRVSVNEDDLSMVEEILPRKNSFVRPPIANIDRLLIVASVANPVPNIYNIDKLTVIAKLMEVEPVIVFTKMDLGDTEPYEEIYRNAGFPVISINNKSGENIDKLDQYIGEGITGLAGYSGVGKSSLVRHLIPDSDIVVGEISRKLKRGRQTTRESTLYKYKNGYITDTVGFSNLELYTYRDQLSTNNLQYFFPEFEKYLGECKFTSCSHTVEKGCKIIEALNDGEIEKTRHENYCKMYQELKSINVN
ncbi:MAG: ribosome small subunit-dependent GTPase A [Eubacterium sp.]|nr:ribosome small subunit-dependent GTPase A [Eubacterium sp.]